jgi:iron complex outermembrane recepter protein
MRLLLLLLMASSIYSLQAQKINGIAKDETGNPMNGTTISLLKATDSSIVKLGVTRSDGAYSFAGIKPGNYKVVASYVGYKSIYSPSFPVASVDVLVPELTLVKGAGKLNTVNVVTQKPLVEVRADKTILNVEGTINAVGSNALELLRKSPGVLLDKDDNISLAGKNGVQVYVDNRSTPLSGPDLAHYLKSLQSSQVEAIELITNPSSKYDAAGNAGIINIRLVRNKSFGTNGSVNAGWNIGITPKYNAGASLNYRNKYLNIFSTYNFNYATNEQHLGVERTIVDSLFDQAGVVNDRRKSHNFKLGADYFINKKNTIGVMVNGILSNPSSNSYSKSFISNLNAQAIDRVLVADNTNIMKRHNANININYNYTGSKGTSLVVNADKGLYDFNSDQYQRNYYYDPSGQISKGNVIYHMISPAQIHINSIKADYEKAFMKGKLAVGAKSALVKTDNDFNRYDVNGMAEIIDIERSNHFVYKETINAGYANYNRQYKKLMIQLGVRVENTVSDGVTTGVKTGVNNSSFKRSYTDVFPSATITFNKNPKKQWAFTYSRRIDRPAYQDLNPFEFKLDEYTFMKGNVNLRPQYTNSFGVTHTYKFKLNIAANYSHVKDMFTQIMDTVEKSKAFISKKNLATQDIINLNISYPFQYKSYSLFTNVSTNYSKYRANFGTGRQVDLDAFGFNLFAQNSYKFCKTFTAELSGFYNAPTIYMGTFKGKSMYNVDAGLSKQIMKGKATIKVSVSDVFHTMRFQTTSDFAGQLTKINFRGESQQFKLNFTYRFGNSGVKPARQRTTGAEDELKRTQQSSGVGIGNN